MAIDFKAKAEHAAYLRRPKVVKFFYDLETTGTKDHKHSIHQIAGCVEVDGEVAEWFNFNVAPHPKAQIDPKAMEVGGVTEAQIRNYPPMAEVFKKVKALLSRHCDPYNPKDKMYLCGYNNAHFDDEFFRAWFEQNMDEYFHSWFWAGSLDVMVLASEYLISRRVGMENFKLMTVAKTLGIKVDESRLHDALYDIQLTRDVYMIVTGLEIEM